MPTRSLFELVAMLVLLAAAAFARRYATGWQRNALSVALVVLAMLTAFFVFFTAGALIQAARVAQ